MIRKRIRIKRPAYLTFGHMLPSFVTLASASCGMTAILWASHGFFSRAMMLVILGAILDMLDGRLARRFGTASRFGVELDSLADSISFGVAPAFVMFFYAANSLGSIGWIISLAFAMSCVLRLARFNAADGGSAPEYWHGFFTGVPAPAGGILCMLPVALYNATGLEVFHDPWLCLGFMAASSLMMVSRIPTLSLKQLHVAKEWASVILILLIIVFSLAFVFFWKVLSVIWVGYLLTIPFTIIAFVRKRAAALKGAE